MLHLSLKVHSLSQGKQSSALLSDANDIWGVMGLEIGFY